MSYQDLLYKSKYNQLLQIQKNLNEDYRTMLQKTMNNPAHEEAVGLFRAVKTNDAGEITRAIEEIKTKSKFGFRSPEEKANYLDRTVQVYDLLSSQLPETNSMGHAIAVKGLNQLMI